MSVPLDRLYHYLTGIVNHDLVIYRWMPHGSRKLEDLTSLHSYSWNQSMTYPLMICHDQESLIFDYYTRDQINQQVINYYSTNNLLSLANDLVAGHRADMHIRGAAINSSLNLYDKTLLLHSELNSTEVEKYKAADFIPVYYWSHALIAKDWFRYAEHDPELKFSPDQIDCDFLIYNRAWSGVREYRLKFTEHLVNHKLISYCHTSFNPVDNLIHYKDHQFVNSELAIKNYTLDQYLPENSHNSSSSADYNNQDYKHCAMEIVLETLFDDSRWHLTEKTLRPIACGKPFILMSTPGSLQYLKQYGFKTFDAYIDESYDQINNSCDRMQAVIAEMKRISALDKDKKNALWNSLNDIAQYNKKVFFKYLQTQVVDEYIVNLNFAMTEIKKYCTGKHHYDSLKLFPYGSKEADWVNRENNINVNLYPLQIEQWLEQCRSR